MKIVLLGYMGCGKSTVGKLLAQKLNYDFVDLDEYLSESENSTITEIFEKKGEIYFRKLENLALQKVLNLPKPVVLALGGGTPCYGNNENLYLNQENVYNFYLKANMDTLYKRLKLEKNKRPLIANLDNHDLKEFIAKHLFERSFFYEKALHIINVNNVSTEEIVEKIINLT